MGTSFLNFTGRSGLFFWNLVLLCSLQTQIVSAQPDISFSSLAVIRSTFPQAPDYGGTETHKRGNAIDVLCLSVDASCPELDNGSVQATPVSGSGPFAYLWNTGATTPALEAVAPGTYSVTVTDASGFSGQASALVGISPVPPLYVDLFDPFCQDQPAAFTAEAGFANYQWELSDPLDVILEGQGTHAITVKWGSSGSKNIRANFSNAPDQCAGIVTFNTIVEVCAATQTTAVSKINLTPNPFGNYLELSMEDSTLTGMSVQLTDIQGAVLIQEHLKSGRVLLETEHLPPGVYLLSLNHGQAVQMWRVVKQ